MVFTTGGSFIHSQKMIGVHTALRKWLVAYPRNSILNYSDRIGSTIVFKNCKWWKHSFGNPTIQYKNHGNIVITAENVCEFYLCISISCHRNMIFHLKKEVCFVCDEYEVFHQRPGPKLSSKPAKIKCNTALESIHFCAEKHQIPYLCKWHNTIALHKSGNPHSIN